MKKCCIAIPIYKEELNVCEELSLNRAIKMCNNIDICLFHPNNLDISEYSTKYNHEFILKAFDDKYFKSVDTYSQLCLSYEFYDAFSEYEYMLLHQLDCWIFENNIEEWCDKGYDYVGGPILSQYSMWIDLILNKGTIPQVGNGGFSLRKISTMKEVFDREGEIFKSLDIVFRDEFINTIPEDYFICNIITKYYYLNIPSWKIAQTFSWDWNPDILYTKFKKLPMGCHAVFKQLGFYQNFIDELNNEDVIKCAKDDWSEIKQKQSKDNGVSLHKKSETIIKILKEEGLV